MKKHVPKRSLCKKLPKSFKTTLIWVYGHKEPRKKEVWDKWRLRNMTWYPAPLAGELIRELLRNNLKLDITSGSIIFTFFLPKLEQDEKYFNIVGKSLPTALCELYLWAIKEGYIKGGKL